MGMILTGGETTKREQKILIATEDWTILATVNPKNNLIDGFTLTDIETGKKWYYPVGAYTLKAYMAAFTKVYNKIKFHYYI